MFNISNMSEEINKIEIRSDEVQEILGYIPHWVIRSGIGGIFVILVLLFIGSWFFKYPDIINSSISVTTENPPAHLIAKKNGNIDKLYVNDKQVVDKGEVLAIVENSSNYSHIKELEFMLDSLQNFFLVYNPELILQFKPNYELGEIQASYSVFFKLYQEYQCFISLNYYNLKISALQKQLQQTYIKLNGQHRLSKLLMKELTLAAREFSRDSGLYELEYIPDSDYDKAKVAYIQKKYSWESSKTQITDNEILITQLKQAILDLQLQKQEQQNNFQLQLKSAYDVLKSEIEGWKLVNLFKSPINGQVSFSKIWSKNQNITSGEVAFTVVPFKKNKIIGILQLPIAGSGKVKTGQKVNIKFNSFPFMEYGLVQGTIKSIALIPEKGFYLVAVNLPQNLKTNYGKELPFSQQMDGIAEIITENISILERLFNPIRAIIKKYK